MQDPLNFLRSLELSPFEQYALHFWAGLLIAFLSKKNGFWYAVAAGLIKEIYDEYIYSGFDIIDLGCTILGAIAKILCLKIKL